MDGIIIFQIVIYALLLPPNLFCLVKHGRPGLLGYFFVNSFCILRIVGSALVLSNGDSASPSVAASIISSIGLSPLLLAAVGVLQEGHHYRQQIQRPPFFQRIFLLLHFLIIAGLVLAIIGNLPAGGQPVTTDPHKLTDAKTGIALLFAAFMVLVILTIIVMLAHGADPNYPTYRSGTILVYSVVASLPFLAIRSITSLVAVVTRKADLRSLTGSTAIRACCYAVPEAIVIIILIIGGIVTRHVRRVPKAYEETAMQLRVED